MKEILYGLWILSLAVGVITYQTFPSYMVGFIFGMVSIKLLELAKSSERR